MRIKTAGFTFLLFFYLTTNFAIATTLKEGIELAYNNSDSVFIKLHQRDLSEIDRDSAILNFFPSLKVDLLFGKTGKFNKFEMGDKLKNEMSPSDRIKQDNKGSDKGKTFSTSYQFQATLPLSFHKTIPNFLASKANLTANNYEYNNFLEEFGLLFIEKYMDVIYYTKAQDVYEQMDDILEKKLKKAEVLKKYGTMKNDKVVIAEAQLYENKSNKIKIKSSLEQVKMDYTIITGRPPEKLEAPDVEKLVLPVKNKQEFIDLVIAGNSKLMQASEQLVAQKMAMIGQNLNLLPDLFVSYSIEKSHTPHWMKRKADQISVGATWTINGTDNSIGNARKSYKNYRIAELNKNLTQKQVEQDAEYSWEQYFSMRELVKATSKALKASTDSLKEVKISVSTGSATFIDEMEIENNYLNANLNYLNAQKSLILSYYKLISMTGVGKIPVI